jgi:hypothetical protein
MTKHTYALVLLALIWLIALTHAGAIVYHWYWIWRWLDIPVHFVGGLWIGLMALYLWLYVRTPEKCAMKNPFVVALVAGLVMGVLWEGYEAVLWQLGPGFPVGYWTDTGLDLVMDLLGALVAATLVVSTNTYVQEKA